MSDDQKKPEFLLTDRGRGKELCDMLRAALKIPEHAKGFEVRFACGEFVTVRCEYMPKA